MDGAPPSPLRAQGQLELAFAYSQRQRRTIARLERQAAPLKFIRDFAHGDRAALVHLHNTSGGVLSGDRLVLQVRADAGTHGILTTTGATRIYRARSGDAPARQITEATLGREARLEYLPDPTIPFRASTFQQESVWRLDAGAGLLLWDVLAPGRSGDDERFGYAEFGSRLGIYVGSRPIALERFELRPSQTSVDSPVRLAGRTHLGTLYFCDATLTAGDCLSLEQALHAELASIARELAQPRLRYGVSALAAHGVSVRVVDDATGGILVAFARLRSWLKRRVWATDDPLPRKIY